jgi:hypothetical protein
LFLRRCKSTAKTRAKQCFSHNFPEKPTILGKIGHFLGKIKSLHAQQGKTRKNRIILTKRQENTLIFLQAFPHTLPENLLLLGKIGGFLGKQGHYWENFHVFGENGNLVKNIVHAPLALKGQKLLAQGNRPG